MILKNILRRLAQLIVLKTSIFFIISIDARLFLNIPTRLVKFVGQHEISLRRRLFLIQNNISLNYLSLQML